MNHRWDLWNGEGADGYEYSESIFQLANKLKPQHGLEIGVRFGKSALPFLLGSTSATLIGVDPNPEFEIVDFMKRQGVIDRFHFVNKASPFALLDFTGMQFDWIYVDGLHDYDGVWRDFVAAWPLLAPEGVMVFDDCDDSLGYGTGVLKMLEDWTEHVTGKPFTHVTTDYYGCIPNPHKAAILVK